MRSSLFDDFLQELRELPSTGDELVAEALHCINRFFFQRDQSADSYSPFQAYWRENHAGVLALEVDSGACAAVATILHSLYLSRKFVRLSDKVDVSGVPRQTIANVRFFTAAQDFKVDIYKKNRNPYKDSESNLFDAERIVTDASVRSAILQYLGAGGSQTDKRHSWMIAQAQFLIDHYSGNAFNIAGAYDLNAADIKSALAGETGIGFKEKKADMFLRDMAELNVWNFQAGFESINVASDANTMRVALRTGILRGRTPLVSSMLDVYSYQYMSVDQQSQAAWRRVWELWGKLHPETQPKAPASMDFMIYDGIGKTFCLKTPRCTKNDGCYFNSHCPASLRRLQPPKSISMYGQTGWKSASSDEGGGLGLSS